MHVFCCICRYLYVISCVMVRVRFIGTLHHGGKRGDETRATMQKTSQTRKKMLIFTWPLPDPHQNIKCLGVLLDCRFLGGFRFRGSVLGFSVLVIGFRVSVLVIGFRVSVLGLGLRI